MIFIVVIAVLLHLGDNTAVVLMHKCTKYHASRPFDIGYAPDKYILYVKQTFDSEIKVKRSQ